MSEPIRLATARDLDPLVRLMQDRKVGFRDNDRQLLSKVLARVGP